MCWRQLNRLQRSRSFFSKKLENLVYLFSCFSAVRKQKQLTYEHRQQSFKLGCKNSRVINVLIHT